MQPDINGMLGQASTPTEENPLEKISEASKDASKKPKETNKDSEKFDDETIKQILMAGDNSEGLFTPKVKDDEDNPKHADVNEEAVIKQGAVSKPKGKYIKNFKEDLIKNPGNYKVQTPKGEMTIAEAMRKGYNPITKQFEKDKSPEEIKKKHMEGLNNADKAKLEELTNPSAARIAPKDAASMGLPVDSPMIAGQVPQEQPQTMPQGEPQATLPAEETAQQGGVDINSLLGGNV